MRRSSGCHRSFAGPSPSICFLESRVRYHRRRHKGLSPLTDGLTVVLHFNVRVSLDSAGARGILDRSVGRMDGWFDDRRDVLLRHADSRCIFLSFRLCCRRSQTRLSPTPAAPFPARCSVFPLIILSCLFHFRILSEFQRT